MSRPPIPFYIARSILGGFFRSALKIRVEGRENIPKKGPYILISNHLNWSDPFILFSIFPPAPRMIFVAERNGSYDSKFKKAFMDAVGKPILPIDREDSGSRVKTLKGMMGVLKEGHVLGIFPEGRMAHKEGEPFPFYVGAFTVAKKMGVPVLPIGMAGTSNLSLRKPIHIRIGQLTTCLETETDEDFACRMALKIRELIPPYPGDGPYPHKMNWLTGLCQGQLRPFEGERDLIVRQRRDKS